MVGYAFECYSFACMAVARCDTITILVLPLATRLFAYSGGFRSQQMGLVVLTARYGSGLGLHTVWLGALIGFLSASINEGYTKKF